jgi:DNA-binding CsgD family transcriptional regulator
VLEHSSRALAHGLLRGTMRRTARGTVPWVRYGVPVAMIAATLGVADLLHPVLPGGGMFLLLLLPVMVAALVFGLLPGLAALGSGAIGAGLLALGRGHPWLNEPLDLIRLALYLALGSAIVVVAWILHNTTETASLRSASDLTTTATLIEPLTPREEEVLALAAAGLSTTAIGHQLFLSRNTVKSHLAHAYAKLGAHNRAEAVAAGIHSGSIGSGTVTARAVEITLGQTRDVSRSGRQRVRAEPHRPAGGRPG